MKVADGIYRIDGVSGNAYIMTGEKLTLIDTGMAGSGKKIVEFIRTTLKMNEHELDTIVITHQHIDHAGSALWLRNQTGARIAIHEADAPYVSGETKPLGPKGATGIAFALFSPFFRMMTFSPDVKLKNGDVVGTLHVLHIPGHTPGSIALFDPGQNVAFTGDIISSRSGRVEFAPDAFNHDGEQMRKSLGTLVDRKFNTLFPGHGDPITGDAVRAFAEREGVARRSS